MNWTGGCRARHNSKSALNTSARLQKQYFARVRMARESEQSAGNLVRSSPTGLAGIILPLKPTERREQSKSEQESKIGLGLESEFGQGNSRPLWGPQISRLQQGAKGRKQTNDIGDTGRKKTGFKSKILALGLSEESVKAPKKPEVLKQKKGLLLREGDWLGINKRRNYKEDNSTGNGTGIRREYSQPQKEEPDFGGGNEGDDVILLEDEEVDELPPLPEKTSWQNTSFRSQQGRNYPPESLDGNDSIFLEVGNVRFSTSRKKTQNRLLVREKTAVLGGGDLENDIPTSDSMLLNFEDGVLPLMLGGAQREPVPEASPVHGAQAEDPSKSESFFTWSSSSYARKNGRSSTPALPVVGGFGNVGDRARSSPALPTQKPVNTTEGNSDQMIMHRNSSLDAFASSVVAGEDNSDDGQWIDMMLNEYYWGGVKDINPNDVVEGGPYIREQDPFEGHKIKVDLDDDKAWRDFVHQPLGKEDWGEQNEESSKRRKRSKFLYLGDSDDDYLLPLRKKHQVDAQSNAATVGTQLSSSTSSPAPASENGREENLDFSVLGNIDNGGGCSSVVANASESI